MKISKLLPAAAAAAFLALPSAASAETVSVLARGIDNPRGVAVGPDGTVYVASAGRAGDRCMGRGEEAMCFGFTSRVLAIGDNGRKRNVATGFVSLGGPDGTFAVGVDGVSVAPDGRVLAVETSGPPEQVRPLPRALRRQAGKLFDVTSGSRNVIADISAFEWKHNPDRVRGDRNSNPYALLALADRTIVVDAGGNSVLEVRDGQTRLLAVIPARGRRQAVPSSIALGPDGAYYVGELAEAAGRGKARVWRVPAEGGTPTVHASGFTNITGVAFGPDGSLFVTEMQVDPRREDFKGDVVRVAPDGSRTRLGRNKLLAPQGLAIDAEGALYVSNYSVLPRSTPRRSPFRGAGGQVVRIVP